MHTSDIAHSLKTLFAELVDGTRIGEGAYVLNQIDKRTRAEGGDVPVIEGASPR